MLQKRILPLLILLLPLISHGVLRGEKQTAKFFYENNKTYIELLRGTQDGVSVGDHLRLKTDSFSSLGIVVESYPTKSKVKLYNMIGEVPFPDSTVELSYANYSLIPGIRILITQGNFFC